MIRPSVRSAAHGVCRLQRCGTDVPYIVPSTWGHSRCAFVKEFLFGHCFGKGLDRGRGSFRASGEPLEPQDAAVHLRPPQPDPHHRRPRDDPRAVAGAAIPAKGRRPGKPGAAGRHEAAGLRRDRAAGRPLRHALRERPLAGRHADQLPHDPQPAHAPGRAGAHPQLRRAGDLLEEDAVVVEPRIPQDVPQPQRHPQHEPAAGVPGGGRPAEGEERHRRGPQAGHHHRGADRHRLRPGRGGPADPRQRRQHPLDRVDRHAVGRRACWRARSPPGR